jgi:Zn-dependent protease
VGAPFGVPVFLAPSWFLVAGVLTVAFSATVHTRVPHLGAAATYLVSFTFVVLLYASVVVHELSHSVVALRLGLPVRRITVYLLGGVSELEREPEDPAREYLVAIAGPLVSLLLAGLGTALAVELRSQTVPRVLVEELALANGLVTVFNLLPGLPLDGGRVLRATVWKLSSNPETGSVVAAWAGRSLAVLVAAVPFLVLLGSGTSAGLVTVLWFSMLAAFLWSGASQSLRIAQLRARLPQLSLRRLTRPAVPTSASTPLSMALAQLERSRAGSIVVVDTDERPVALVSEAAVAATPPERRPWVPVAEVSVSLEPGRVLPVGLAGEDLLVAMRASPASEYLVVDDAGEVLGVLATTDVARIVTA